MYVARFVDSITDTPSVRLDLNDGDTWETLYEGSDMSPPNLRRAISQTLLADGGQVTAAAYDNRVLRLRLKAADTTADGLAEQLQDLTQELDRPANILQWQPGTTEPVFFRTMRSPITRITEVPGDDTVKLFDVEVLAEPFGYGPKETLPAVTVYSDPAEGVTLNANPNFETDVSDWAAVGGTRARSTAQAHEGTASMLVTPSGSAADVEVSAGYVPIVAGSTVRISAWVRCAVARDVHLLAVWSDGTTETGNIGVTQSVAADTWTLLSTSGTAPAGTTRARLAVAMHSTPPAGHLLYVDEARIRQAGSDGAMYFDVTGVKGDVETPLHLRLSASSVQRQVMTAVRRGGTPSAAPFILQAEDLTTLTDTTLGGSNDPLLSGAGQNYLRTTFATNMALVPRAYVSVYPAVAGTDVRGQYRVFARVRRNVGSDQINLRLVWGNSFANYFGDVVALPTAGLTVPIYVDLGLVQFPSGADPVSEGVSGVELSVRGMYLEIRASRALGAGTLDWDFLLFVPADDRLMIALINADAGGTAQILDSGRAMIYGVGSSGEVRPSVAAEISGGPPMVSPGVTNRVMYAPNILQASVGDKITDSTEVVPYYWPRYLYARSAAS